MLNEKRLQHIRNEYEKYNAAFISAEAEAVLDIELVTPVADFVPELIKQIEELLLERQQLLAVIEGELQESPEIDLSKYRVTKQQRRILQWLIKEIREKGYAPTTREIGQAVGLRSSATVHAHLTSLEEKGLIRREPGVTRAIQILI